MEAHRLGLPIAVGIAVVAAGAATFALRPRSGLIHPAPVAAEAYFSASELDRAHDYRGPQRLLALGGIAVEGATLAVLALRPPRRLRRARDVGLSTQNWAGWSSDVAKATAISVVITAGGAALLMALIRRFPRSWFA